MVMQTGLRKLSRHLLAGALTVIGASVALTETVGSVLITEVNSGGVGGDFFELYNSGSTAVDLGGWKWVDNASAANGGPSFNGVRAYAFNSFTLQPGGVALVVTDASGNTDGNTAFASSWGNLVSPQFLTFTVPTGTGNGLGSNDLVALFDSTGAFRTGVNYGTVAVAVTQGDSTTVNLAPFNRSPDGVSLGTTAGQAGGGTSGTQSLVWDPTSDPSAPLYLATTSVGQIGAFASVASATTIGSPGIVTAVVPEPSTVALAVAGLGLAGLAARRRLRKA